MLLTLLKVTFFFAVILALALGAMNLSENGHPLVMQFNGVEYAVGPLKAAVIALVLIFVAWLLVQILRLFLAIFRFLIGDKTAIDRYFDRSRERKGYKAMAEGMLAVASGEGKLAQDHATKAAKYLDQTHLTNLLAAQAAETAGDAKRAEQIYRDMLADNRTRFVGIRGLMQQKLASGDTGVALKLAEKAYALKPSHSDLQNTLLTLQTREHDWKGARQTLRDKRRQGALPQDVHLRRDAVLALQEASEVLAQGNSLSAREAAISANKASPDLVPAAVLASRSYMAQKDTRSASRLLQKAWEAQPHPSIAAAYAEIVPDETPAQRLRRFEDLTRLRPDHAETKLLKAELALAAEDFPGARRALGDLAETQPSTRSLAIMAAVERGEGADDSIVRGLLARAMNASRGPQWVCENCHNIMAEWSPVCDSCHGFDTLSWKEPPPAAWMSGGATNGVEMLPLIVGRPNGATGVVPSVADQLPPPEPAVVAAEPPPADTRADIPAVTPGIVPRESDYAPSSTITAPDPNEPPRRRVAAREVLATEPDAMPAFTPARPAIRPPAKPERQPEPSDDDATGNPPVRPDVEPPESENDLR